MRITHQQIYPMKELSNNLEQFIGKVLDGKVVIKEAGLLKLFIFESESLIKLQVSDAEGVEKGDFVKILFSRSDTGQIVGELIDFSSKLSEENKPSFDKMPLEKETFNVLEKMGLRETPENFNLIYNMKKLNMPITKATIESVQQFERMLKTLTTEIKALPKESQMLILDKFEIPLKNIVLDLVNQNFLVNTMPSNDFYDGLIERIPSDLLPILAADLSDPDPILIISRVLNLLENIDTQQALIHVKNDENVTFKSLIHSHNNFNPLFSQADAFEKIISVIKKTPLNEVQSKEFLELISKPLIDKDRIETVITWIKNASLESESKETLLRNFEFIKASFESLKPEGQDVYMIQVPIELEDRHTRVDLYYKKSKNKTKVDKFSILLALKTSHFGDVRCLVEKNHSHFRLTFGFDEEKTLSLFQSKKNILLQGLDHHSVTINFNLWSQVKEDFEKSIKSDSYELVDNHIDIRL